MKTIKLNDLMGLERLLLEIDIKYKFGLSFNDVYMLHIYLSNVGKITSYFFFNSRCAHRSAKQLKQ